MAEKVETISTAKSCICGNVFVPYYSEQKYCSPTCYWKDKKGKKQKEWLEKTCERCGIIFLVPPHRVTSKFCGNICRWESMKGVHRNKIERVQKNCKGCNNLFEDLTNGKRKYCSQRCYLKNQPKKVTTIICENCGKEFLGRPKRRFCSHRCHYNFMKEKTGTAINEYNRRRGKSFLEIFGEEQAEKIRDKMSKIQMGHTAWNKGLTKETDVRIQAASEKMRKTKFEPAFKMKLDKYKETFIENLFKNSTLRTYGYESERHYLLKLKIAKNLEREGFIVELEKFVSINNKLYVIDIFCMKIVRNVAVEFIVFEIGTCSKEKLKALSNYYNKVMHVPFNKKPYMVNRFG